MFQALELKDFIESDHSIQLESKSSLRGRAQREAEERGMKFFELSSKCSTKREIENVFVELLNQNEIYRFERRERRGAKNYGSRLLPQCPCNGDDDCNIY